VRYVLEHDPLYDEIEVVETVDEAAAYALPAYRNLYGWITEEMLPKARDKDGNEFVFLSVEAGRKVYFGPPRREITGAFKVGIGQSRVVQSFTPTYPAELARLGSLGTVVHVVNPDEKTYRRLTPGPSISVVLPRLHKGITSSLEILKLDASKAATAKSVAALAACREMARVEEAVRAGWSQLSARVHYAGAALIGCPETLNVAAGDVYRFDVMLPGGKMHWSSGIYRVWKATHRIAESYSVTLELMRALDIEINLVGGAVTLEESAGGS